MYQPPTSAHVVVNSNNPSSNSQSKYSGYQQQSNNQVYSQGTSSTLSKMASNQISPSQSTNGTGVFSQQQITNNQNLNMPQSNSTNYQNTQKKPVSQQQSRKLNGQALNHIKEEEEKVISPTQQTQQPHRPLISYEATGNIDRNTKININSQQRVSQESGTFTNTRHKPTSSQIQIGGGQIQNPGQSKVPESRQGNGEKMLDKRHQMRMTSGDSKKQTPHNITKSLIDEGSEDFTNIEEHIRDDTKISCRNAVASSLNNVSQIIKQGLKQNLRNRRGTTQSNMTSNQPSKEETFETSSFFDEGVGNNHRMIQQVNGQGLVSPHRCNQVEGYNIPTIFNTLMFGIDQNKVSSNVRESFSKVHSNTRPVSQISQNNQPLQQQQQSNSKQYQKQLSNKFAQKQVEQSKAPVSQQQYTAQQQQQAQTMKKNASKDKLSQLVTKVEKSPIMVFDQNQKKNHNGQKQSHQQQVSRNHEIAKKTSTNSQKQQNQSAGRHSQLSMAAQQNLKIEQQIEAPESLTTEVMNKNHEEYGNESEDEQNDEIIQKTVNQIEDFQTSELHRNHLIQTLQSLQYIKTLPPVNKNDIKSRAVRLPPPRNQNIKKTIIFDLDETLVHCIDDIENNPCDTVINVTFPNGETVQAGINVRPYALECLRKANESYQVVVFTASHKAYADVVLDYLDPDRSLIQYRLYRDHCIRTEEGIYIKDLRIITNRQLKDLIIVDNAVYSFGYQLDNGIPIIPFYDDKTDEELMHLIFYINCLANCVDVREQNRKAFQLKDLQEIDIAEYLQSMMSPGNNIVQEEDEEDN